MPQPSLTAVAQELVSQIIHPGDKVIDATAGNGHDTCFLARQVGQHGSVYAFDVQTNALQLTKNRLTEQGDLHQVLLLLHNHHLINQHVSGEIQAAMFNFGYLPGSDKRITTQHQTSLSAVRQCLEKLSSGGIITLLCYRGHQGGQQETDTLSALLTSLDKDHFSIQQYDSPGPILFAVFKN